MNNYIEEFKKIYKPIIDKYQFGILNTYDGDSTGTVILYNNEFELQFIMWREDTDVMYCKYISEKQLFLYDISNFVSSCITDYDRIIDIPSALEQANHTTVYNRNIEALKYLFNIFNNHFTDLLEGKNDWIERYEQSKWYSEPIIRDRRM